MKRTAALVLMLTIVPIAAAAANRGRTVRPSPSAGRVVVGQEYRIPAVPDSPWLESVALAMGPSSGIVLWTENGSIRFARLAADGHPLDSVGRVLVQNGHTQQHVAIDTFKDQFVVAWCDITPDKKQIDAIRIDANGRVLDSAPSVVTDAIGSSEPDIGVTCNNAACLVTWAGDGTYGTFSVGAVSAQVLSSSVKAVALLQLTPKGTGNGVGTDKLNFVTTYAEQISYGQSGAFVAKFIFADSTANEVDLLPSTPYQVGSTWMAWSGAQWLILMLDLTTDGELAQEFRFMRMDAAGHVLAAPTSKPFESAGVPLLCPRVPDLFLYDPENRRVVWDGKNFLIFTPRAITAVATNGSVSEPVAADDYFPRSYALSVSSTGGGRTIVGYSRDTAVAIRAIDDVP